ncbi:hypothetical protein D3C85_551540 [compost metagenome]
MKKVFLAATFILMCMNMISCTNDEVETSPENVKAQISADADTGGQTGQTPTTPPKP